MEIKEEMTECRDTQRAQRSLREETAPTVNGEAARVAKLEAESVASREAEPTAKQGTGGVIPQRRKRTVKEEEPHFSGPAKWDPYL